MSAPPRVTVCIPTYRRPHTVLKAVESAVAAAQALSSPGQAEILVAEDASGDRSAQVLAAHPGAGTTFRLVCRPRNLGMSGNLLAMVRDEARGEYVLILTDDDTLQPGALAALLRDLDAAGSRAPSLLWGPRPSYLEDGQWHVTECQSFSASRRVAPGPLSAGRHAWAGFVLSGLVLRRADVDFGAWAEHEANAFFPMLVAGRLLWSRPARYLAEPLVRHTVFNQTHWHRWGPTELDISARLFADFQRVFRLVAQGHPEREQALFHAAALRSRLRNVVLYAAQPAGGLDLIQTRGPGPAAQALHASGVPGWLVPVLAVAGRAARLRGGRG